MFHQLLASLVAIALVGCAADPQQRAQTTAAPPPSAIASFDIIIAHAKIVDGTGSPWFYGDVAINAGKIAQVGNLGQATAKLLIDAKGKVVSPGFIDVHTHADDDLYKLPHAENFIRDGVTTIVVGNCGYGVRDVRTYFDNLETRGVAVNVATLYGHNTILRAVKGNVRGDLTPDQMEQARALLDQAMRDGAVGLSTGLIYTPGQWSSTEEIIELAKVSAKYGGIYASHMRSEGGSIMEAIDEALRIGKESGCRVQISHFKIASDYAKKVGGSDATLARVMEARNAGVEVWVDQYPYTASSTTLSTLMPDWVLEKGNDEAVKILSDETQLQKVLADMKDTYETRRGKTSMKYAVIASQEKHPEYVGKNLEQVARLRKYGKEAELLRDAASGEAVTMEDQYRAAIAIFLDGGASCVFHSMDEENVANILKHPLVAIASDAGVREFGSGQPHPRGYGTNARVLGRYARELKLITLEDAVRKMTGLPATAFRFHNRGLLQPGFAADVVIFDADKVIDKSTFDVPHAYSEGFDYVIVNGQLVVNDGKLTGTLPGQPIFGPGRTLSSRAPGPIQIQN